MNGAECYSACGLIFLAGRVDDRGGESYPSRYLHIGARLGFHAPYIEATKLERVPPQLNQGDSRGAEDGRGYRH